MFKQVVRTPKQTTRMQVEALLDFSLAEFCSGIEMLQAAKRTSNTNLAGGFIRHALDEYRHAYLFSSLAKSIAGRHNLIGMQRFLPKHAFIKRYLNRSSYLFESMSFDRFTIFVAISEKYAAGHFSDVLDRETVFNCEEKDILKSILIDEGRHIAFANNAAQKVNARNWVKYKWLVAIERIKLFQRNVNSRFERFHAVISRFFLRISTILVIVLLYFMKKNIIKMEFKYKDLDEMKKSSLDLY